MINTNQIARIALITLLIIGCFYVLRPFMAAVLFAAVFCVFTWPLYNRVWLRLGKRDGLAAMTMTLFLAVAIILPMAYLATNLAESAAILIDEAQVTLQNLQPQAPDWLSNLPLIGEQLAEAWQRAVVSHEELMKLISQYAEPLRKLILNAVQMMMGGFLQLLLVAFVAFFFYRDGRRLSQGVSLMVHRLGGELGEEMLTLSCSTVKGVMLGIFGTALAQSSVALFGFWLAGAPMPLLLALATFFLSVIPIGPPLVWGGTALWLYNHGDHGWAIFMALYGLLAISTVDNVIKPILISHSSHLPLLLVVLGVLGGAIAFGFIGIFLGPTLLAVGLTLISHWVALQHRENK
ncbi:MAG: AI-2E family transporter [Methylotenera sp. 17-45-7]|jgi:predicted PurR-regulated permease PerM|nr:MAG: AI-2E family transporter [Methylotenera sp. 17-45-7]OZA51823.1 MAG: AI-2E family transporter [Methylophilales bacterium 39-45-7]HQS37913.1 AI-2E family transporter [Methylotenera sp.]HQS44090.1 AI-2E family transporter [Methylotenera sp.]